MIVSIVADRLGINNHITVDINAFLLSVIWLGE